MQKGIVLLKPPTVTHEIRAQVSDLLHHMGFVCEVRERFDGALAVAFDGEKGNETSAGDVEKELRNNALLAEANFVVKDLG